MKICVQENRELEEIILCDFPYLRDVRYEMTTSYFNKNNEEKNKVKGCINKIKKRGFADKDLVDYYVMMLEKFTK